MKAAVAAAVRRTIRLTHADRAIAPPATASNHVAAASRQMRRLTPPAAPAGSSTPLLASSSEHVDDSALVNAYRTVASAITKDPQAAGGLGALACVVLLAGAAVRNRQQVKLRPVAAVRVV